MIMFCGLPVMVAVLPTLEAIGIASRYGSGLRLSDKTSSATIGVMIRQMVSLTRNAEKKTAHQHHGNEQHQRVPRAGHDEAVHQPKEARQLEIGHQDHHA